MSKPTSPELLILHAVRKSGGGGERYAAEKALTEAGIPYTPAQIDIAYYGFAEWSSKVLLEAIRLTKPRMCASCAFYVDPATGPGRLKGECVDITKRITACNGEAANNSFRWPLKVWDDYLCKNYRLANPRFYEDIGEQRR